jgi:hypothetical protein
MCHVRNTISAPLCGEGRPNCVRVQIPLRLKERGINTCCDLFESSGMRERPDTAESWMQIEEDFQTAISESLYHN